MPSGLVGICPLPSWQLALVDHSECARSVLKLHNHPQILVTKQISEEFSTRNIQSQPRMEPEHLACQLLDNSGWICEHPIPPEVVPVSCVLSSMSSHSAPAKIAQGVRRPAGCNFSAAVLKPSIRSNILFLQVCLP